MAPVKRSKNSGGRNKATSNAIQRGGTQTLITSHMARGKSNNKGKAKSYSRGTSTAVGFPRYNRSMPLSTKAAGYEESFGKVKRPTRKAKKSRYNAFAQRGVILTNETRGLVQDKDCVYVAHQALPLDQLLRSFCYALVKQVLHHKNIVVSVPTDYVNATGSSGTPSTSDGRFFLGVRGMSPDDNQTTGQNPGSEIFAIEVNTNSTWGTVSELMYSNLLTYYTANAQDPLLVRYLKVDSQIKMPDSTYRTYQTEMFDLWTSKVEFYGSSEFKMQNQSTAIGASYTANTSTDVINSNPLHGRSYETKGQGLLPYRQTGSSQIVTNSLNLTLMSNNWVPAPKTGVATSTAAALADGVLDGSWKEPPPSTIFKGVTKTGSIKLAPGQIQKSNLFEKGRMSISKFITALRMDAKWNDMGQEANTNYISKLGRARYFALEQYMQDVYIEAEGNTGKGGYVKVAFEHDCKIGAKVSLSRIRATNAIFSAYTQLAGI